MMTIKSRIKTGVVMMAVRMVLSMVMKKIEGRDKAKQKR
jgi:hypothetical protein